MRASALTCSSRNECRRFRTPCALLHRSSTDSHAMRPFISPGGDFTHCTRFCIVTDDFVCHAFTSLADAFARFASFYIARRRFCLLRACFLHRTAVISHTAHAFASSPMISCAMLLHRSSTVSHAMRSLHRTAVISHTAHAFTSNADGFTCYACAFYIERR